MKRAPTDADILMYTHLCELGFTIAQEWPFASGRRWRFDFAILRPKIAIEIDGAVWTNGRHNRGSGYVKELEKFNMASLLGWRVFHFLPSQVLDGSAIAFIRRVLES